MSTTTAAAAAHTPGPWLAEPVPPEAHTDPDLQLDTSVHFWVVGGTDEVLALVDHVTREAAEANARLMAAAPELLAALKKAVDIIETWHSLRDADDVAWRIYRDHAPEMQPINGAIAKAEGNHHAST